MDISVISILVPFVAGYAILTITTCCGIHQLRSRASELEMRIATLEQQQERLQQEQQAQQQEQARYYPSPSHSKPRQQPHIYPNYIQATAVPISVHHSVV